MTTNCATCKGEGCASIGRNNCGQYQPTMDALFDGSNAYLLDERAEYEAWCDIKIFPLSWKKDEGAFVAWKARGEIDAKRIAELEALLAQRDMDYTLHSNVTGSQIDKVRALQEKAIASTDTEKWLQEEIARRLGEPVAWMYPSDLEKFQTRETFAQAFSVEVGCPDESSVALYRFSKP